ncbi:MAG: plastocyanin/azurin family copper-binding protein [Thermodesulfobacteriota bacterium]
MLRFEKIPLLLLALFVLFAPAQAISAEGKAVKKTPEAVIEGFVTGLVEQAAGPGVSPETKEALLERALRFAETYGMIEDDDALLKKTEKAILTLPGTSISGDEQIIKDFQEIMLHGRRLPDDPTMGKVKKRVEELVYGLIDRAFEPGTSKDEEKGLLDAARDFAEAYSGKTGDEAFYRAIEHSIRTLPYRAISSDGAIIKAFQKAMRHDNRLAMEFLVKKVEPRIEPFVQEIIARALDPSAAPEEKDRLLKTAMNFAKTFGRITGDQAFHRVIHRKTFTARLSEPLLTEPGQGVHIIVAPRASETVKNVFRPDNIVIRAGETVRWVNKDEIIHVIGTLDFLSDGHFFEPRIGPLGSFEHTFRRPGEYYYICFIHNSMIGKITVKK